MQKTTLLKNILIFFGAIVLLVLFFGIGSKNEINQLASIVETQEIVPEKIIDSQKIGQNSVNDQKEMEVFYPVVKVVDGDTVTLNIDGQNQTLRLIGIDTPETVDPRKPVQCFGVEASNKAKEVLTGQKVRMEKDSTQGELDKYNRLLAYVFLEDGTNFNKMMIEQGYAYEYTYNLPYKYQTEFKLAEQVAREEKRGLWAEDTCNGETIKVQEISVVEQNDPIMSSNSTTISKPIKSDCSSNLYNCTDFKTHAEAQATYDYCGGVNNDIHRLDNDKDGEACESLP